MRSFLVAAASIAAVVATGTTKICRRVTADPSDPTQDTNGNPIPAGTVVSEFSGYAWVDVVEPSPYQRQANELAGSCANAAPTVLWCHAYNFAHDHLQSDLTDLTWNCPSNPSASSPVRISENSAYESCQIYANEQAQIHNCFYWDTPQKFDMCSEPTPVCNPGDDTYTTSILLQQLPEMNTAYLSTEPRAIINPQNGLCEDWTASPTQTPTLNPTPNPTQYPTQNPTQTPTPSPSPYPTPSPTAPPKQTPNAFTPAPTNNPTPNPTPCPTDVPTHNPTYKTPRAQFVAAKKP